MFKKAIITAVALGISAPAFAGSGKEQLAAQLGVNANDYTIAELITLEDRVYREEEATASKFFGASSSTRVSSKGGVAFQISEFADDDDAAHQTFGQGVGVDGYSRVSTRNSVSAGKAQLARLAGVSNPNNYSVAELLQIRSDRLDHDEEN